MTDKRYPMSKVDTAWLRMEEPTNLMMITGVMGLQNDIDFQRLVDTIALRFLAFPRFRYKAVYGARISHWEFDEDFDIYSHVRRTALPGAAGREELQELVSELASTPLDQSKPLWQFHLVENHTEGPVLIVRIHHCYADGIALIQVMLSLTDPGPEPRASASSPHQWRQKRAQESNIFRRFLEPARDGLDTMVDWGQKAVEEMLGLLRNPEQMGAYANEALDIADELSTVMLLGDDPQTRFKGRLGVRKRVAWTDPLPLKEVKAVGRALGCTVNDVLISSATGALNHYLRCCGEDPGELEIRATVPVNLRPLEHAKNLGNHFGLVFLQLPVGIDNPLQRLLRVHEHMEELKNSRQAVVAFGLLAALGMGPAAIQKPMLDMMSRKASAVLTNVPGPRRPLYLAGTAVREMMFWVPQNGSIGMGISILSYNQQVYMGLITDRRLVPDPEAIVSRFRTEFDKLLYLALQLPDGDIAPDDVQAWVSHWAADGRPGLNTETAEDSEHENIVDPTDEHDELAFAEAMSPAAKTASNKPVTAAQT
ncbi:MAG: wax ester/triacylglycerol synthase family O-acyltransferase, partial [Gammaproteobacteria bacterium]|nr:wax ester/triacylglycerol synthase family O-acyltransferase [Gammaproteobacteria bacterium]